ncbi:hypothetical protein COOONC_19434 [Cooperia oncophora]
MDDNTRYKILYYHEGTRNVLALGESPGFQLASFHPLKIYSKYDIVPEPVTENPSELRMRKYNFISAAIDDWLMPSDRYPIEGDVDTKRMAYDKIYEVGCNYEECPKGDETQASLICIYNTNAFEHDCEHQIIRYKEQWTSTKEPRQHITKEVAKEMK